MSEKRERSNTKEETVPKRETRKGEKKKKRIHSPKLLSKIPNQNVFY